MRGVDKFKEKILGKERMRMREHKKRFKEYEQRWKRNELWDLSDYSDFSLAERLIYESYLFERDVLGRYISLVDMLKIFLRMADSLSSSVDPISNINDVLFSKFNITYPSSTALMTHLLEYRRGNCYSITGLFLSLAEIRKYLGFGWSMIPGHVWVRYRTDKGYINIDPSRKGEIMPDEFYIKWLDRFLENYRKIVGYDIKDRLNNIRKLEQRPSETILATLLCSLSEREEAVYLPYFERGSRIDPKYAEIHLYVRRIMKMPLFKFFF